jgi:hypothetical protein
MLRRPMTQSSPTPTLGEVLELLDGFDLRFNIVEP